jgi:hypothetical protein
MYGKLFWASIMALMLAGCATPEPKVDTSAEAEMTFDGLFPVTNSRAQMAWARADLDLTPFSKVMLEGVGVEYRPGGESGRTWQQRSSSGGPFEITEAQKERFESLMRETFIEELGRSERFTIVTEPGPDVLLVRGALLDVVSFVPPDSVGRSDVFLSRVGEATLVLEIRDSITEAIMVRAIDRRAAERVSGSAVTPSNRVTNATEVRRLARTWARMLRERLDEFGVPVE